MARPKVPTDKKQSERITVNLTPLAKKKFDALLTLEEKNASDFLNMLIESAIKTCEKQIEQILKVDADRTKKIQQIKNNHPKIDVQATVADALKSKGVVDVEN